GAGSGKTSVITQKIAWLVQQSGIPARHIAAVTFTNKAAREMKERVGNIIPRSESRGLIVSTFHNLGLRILKQEQVATALCKCFSILDQIDSRELLKEVLHRGDSEEDILAVDAIHHQISHWKNELVTPASAMSHADTPEQLRAAVAYGQYYRMLRGRNAVEFVDAVMLLVDVII